MSALMSLICVGGWCVPGVYGRHMAARRSARGVRTLVRVVSSLSDNAGYRRAGDR